MFPNPIKTTIVPTISNQISSSEKREATYPIYFKSFELAIYGGMFLTIIE